MLGELKRRVVDTTLLGVLKTDWDWLIYGQHYGLKTRLLDWTSNPLISLWFSLMENRRDGYLYILSINKSNTISDISQSPFELEKNEILKPNFNNRRIVSQSGWFSVHPYSVESGEYIPLNKCENLSNKIIEVKIPKRYTSDFVKKLDTMGINSEFIFQDVAGICNHINWQYKF